MTFSIFSRVVHRIISPISGEIIVREQFGQYTLYVKGIPQSEGIVRGIWKKGVNALPVLSKTSRVLLLGLGGGSVVKLLKKKYPEMKILGVELDPKMVMVGRTYFGLDKVPGLKIVTSDAFKIVSDKKGDLKKGKFDLILVDIYLGDSLPDFVEKEDFISQLKDLLSEKGILVFNHLLNEKGKETVQAFEKRLKKIFPRIKTLQAGSNELLFAYQG